MPLNPTKLKPIEIVRIVNTTPLMAVLNDRQLRRHRDRAGFRISEDGGQTVNLFKYAAWLRSELMLRQSMTPLTYEEKKNAARNRNLALAMAGRDIGELPEVVNPERKKRCRTDFRLFCETYFPEAFSLAWSPDHLKAIQKSKRLFFAAACSLWPCHAAPGRAASRKRRPSGRCCTVTASSSCSLGRRSRRPWNCLIPS